MKLLPIIIFIIIVVNVLRRIAEFNRNRPKSGDEGWEEWGDQPSSSARPPASSSRPLAAPRPAPVPSERVREILEELAQGDRPRPAPGLPPSPARPLAAPPPVPPVVPLPPPVAVARPAAPAGRRYLSQEAVEAAQEVSRDVAADVPHLAAPLAGDTLVRESLGKALPPTVALAHEARVRHRRPYFVRARGRRNLRQAIVLAEVLGPPRAYDV